MIKILGCVLLLGVVIVSASTTASSSFQPIGNYPNAFVTYARGLNSIRAVVGLYQPPGGFYHGYLQVAKTYKTVEPPGVLASYLQGINDKGVAVGGYCDTASCNGAPRNMDTSTATVDTRNSTIQLPDSPLRL